MAFMSSWQEKKMTWDPVVRKKRRHLHQGDKHQKFHFHQSDGQNQTALASSWKKEIDCIAPSWQEGKQIAPGCLKKTDGMATGGQTKQMALTPCWQTQKKAFP